MMKCSKCGAEIKNLPDYIADTGADVLCSHCAGTDEEREGTMISFDRFYGSRSFSASGSSDETELAA